MPSSPPTGTAGRTAHEARGGAGDVVLVEVGRRMASVATSTVGALLALDGGEEFSMLLPITEAGAIAAIGEQLHATVAARPIEIDVGALDITISVGAAAACPSVLAANQLSHAADRALYRAKAGGRDRVELAGVGDA